MDRMAHPYWPLFDIGVTTPRLALRPITDDVSVALAELAANGVHDPAFAPFAVPWTDLPPGELERGVLQFHWRTRAETSPQQWRVQFAAFVGDEIIGATDLAATDFRVHREFETGSWLGRDFQGRGLGKEMRLATISFGFLGLGAQWATTGAWHDNGPSLGVTESLGYQRTGTKRSMRRDRSDVHISYEMNRTHFEAELRRDDIEIECPDSVRELLGID